MAIEFEIVDIEEKETPPDAASSDLACEVCNAPLVYSGRGRKPKRCDEHKTWKGSASNSGTSRTGVGKGSANVEQAVATLENLYDAVGLAFLLTSPTAAGQWTENVPELQTRNRQILQGDPELTKSINRLGVKGGKFAFAAAQLWAVTPPALVAIQETRARNAERTATQRRARMRQQNTGTPGEPDTAPGPEFPNRSFFG